MAVEPIPARLTAERIACCRAEGHWTDEVMPALLERQARRSPEKTAVVDGEQRVSWARLLTLSKRLALHLHRLGVRRGDVVAIQLPNWLEYVVAYHAVGLLGGVVCQPVVDWRSVETEYALGIGPAKAAIIPHSFRGFSFIPMIDELRPKLAHLEHVLVARGPAPSGYISLDALMEEEVEARAGDDVLKKEWLGANDVSRLLFTSGTTGLPKAIMHTDNTSLYVARENARVHRLQPEDVVLMFVPLSFNWGTTLAIHTAALLGSAVVLMERFSPEAALRLIEQEKVTYLPGSPTTFIGMLNHADFGRHDYGSLRLTISGGTTVPLEVVQGIRKGFRVPFLEIYGLNEMGVLTSNLLEDDPEEVDGKVGAPLPGTEGRIVDDAGSDVAVGEPGEVLLRGPSVCVGYHRNPEANATMWDSEGWLHTGDLGTLDGKGRLAIVGRKKDLIKRGGASISPREVEEEILAHPKVLNAAVVGLPDAYYGEVVCACVIPRQGESITLEEMVEFLRPRIARYKLPVKVVVCGSFPATSSGKVQKQVLRERIVSGAMK